MGLPGVWVVTARYCAGTADVANFDKGQQARLVIPSKVAAECAE
jgi:hypothetical protein